MARVLLVGLCILGMGLALFWDGPDWWKALAGTAAVAWVATMALAFEGRWTAVLAAVIAIALSVPVIRHYRGLRTEP